MQPFGARTYTPSGRVTPQGLLLTTVLAGGVGAVVGPAYAYLSVYNPFIYVTFLATLGFGFAMAAAGALGARVGKMRSPAIGAACAVIGAGFGLYAHWVVWAHALAARADVDIWLVAPVQLGAFLANVAEEGVWSIAGVTPTGLGLYAIWAAEGAAIVAIPAHNLWTLLLQTPFCERCDRWIRPTFASLPLAETDPNELRHALSNGDLGALRVLPLAQGVPRIAATLAACPGRGDVGYLTVEHVTSQTNRKGETEQVRTGIVTRLALTSEQVAVLRDLPECAAERASAVGAT